MFQNNFPNNFPNINFNQMNSPMFPMNENNPNANEFYDERSNVQSNESKSRK